MTVFYIWWNNFALNICILIKGKQFYLFLFTFGSLLKMCVSNHFKEFHRKNKTVTLGGECWWQRGQENFWELPYMLVSSTGLELPWVQGLLHVVPLGFASRGMYNENIPPCVCAHTPRRTAGLWSLLLGLGRKASNCCGPCRRCPDQYPGKRGPSPGSAS